MSAPEIQQEDIESVVAALKSGTLGLGPVAKEFEKYFADFVGAKYAVTVSSGTAGLHLCMHMLNLAPDNEVITTPFGFIASVNSILYEGAKPVFVDIDENTLNMNALETEAAITPRTRAIMPVHVFGQPCDMDAFTSLAAQHDVPVIEDACEAVGAAYRGQRVGTFGQSAVFSFYPNKQMTTGEGAIVTTNDPRAAELLKSLRNQGRDQMGTWLQHVRLGYNYRMDEMSAALGLSQLRRLDQLLDKRQRVAARYLERLAGQPGVRLPFIAPTTTQMSWFVFVVRLEAGIDRDRVAQQMADHGIPTRAYFSPLHLQPYMRDRFGFREGDFPVTERVAAQTLALPFHGNLGDDAIDQVAEALRDALRG